MSLGLSPASGKRKKLFYYTAALVFAFLVTAGIFARNRWFPTTDPITGKPRTGWFGKSYAFTRDITPEGVTLTPNPTPQLKSEYIYAGQRLLAVEDANANAAPPSDLAVWRPSSGQWWVLGQNGTTVSQFGVSTDIPVPGDFDGDGKTDFAVYRPSTGEWWQSYSSTGGYGAFQFGGNQNDMPAPGDFDGDGKTDAVVFRRDDPSVGLGTYYVRRSADGSYYAIQFGLSSDIPAPADYDGDGRADIAIWRSSDSTFYAINSSSSAAQYVSMGSSTGSKVVSADYDGDGRADHAVFDPSTANWYIRQSTSGTVITVQWGSAGDIPVQNDYDGDGKCDIATWRNSNGNWYIRQSAFNNSLRQQQFGASGDIPVPAYYRR